MAPARPTLLIARREARLLRRGRAARGAALLLAAVAWLPAALLPLRSGTLGLASFAETLPLQIAICGVVLPLLALLAGAELLAGELEDGSLVPALTLPISRRACFAGKLLGRGALMAAAYVAAFLSAGLALTLAHGVEGAADWAAAACAGLLLSLVSGAIGAALGASGWGRVRAFAAALVAWVILVFALDAVLLTAVVALAPKPPEEIGRGGHEEITAPRGSAPMSDPHARHAGPEEPSPFRLSTWLMALNPVDLFRLTALAAAPGLRPRLALALPGATVAGVWIVVVAGWLFWLLLPPLLGLRRFERADLG